MVHFFVLVFFCLGSELDVFAYGVNDKCIYYVFLVYLHIYLKETSWISLQRLLMSDDFCTTHSDSGFGLHQEPPYVRHAHFILYILFLTRLHDTCELQKNSKTTIIKEGNQPDTDERLHYQPFLLLLWPCFYGTKQEGCSKHFRELGTGVLCDKD